MLFRSLFIVVLLIYAPNTGAKQPIKKQLTFIIGVETTPNFPLYGINERGEFIGLYRKIFDKFAADNNINFIYKPYKINKLFYNYFNHKVDFKFPDNPIWRAADKLSYQITYSSPIYFYIEALFVRPTNVHKTIDDIHHIGLVGDIALWSIHHYIELNKINIKLNSCKKLIKQLLANELDGVLCNYFVMHHSLAQLKLDNLLVPNFNLPHIDDFYYLSSINHPDIIYNFNVWFKNHKDEIDKCHLKYFNNTTTQHQCIFK